MSKKLIDNIYLWGQDAGTHHILTHSGKPNINPYKLPGENKMGPVEGAEFLGLKNVCRVVSDGLPVPPFFGEAEKLTHFDNVVWSIIGCGASGDGNTVDAVIDIAKIHPNITGVIMDDFMKESRMEMYPPETLAGFKKKIADEVGREIPLWCVIYAAQLTESRTPYLNECDVVTFWTWKAEELKNLEENLKLLKSLTTTKKIMLGIYLHDYGGRKLMDVEDMKMQLAFAKEKYLSGEIQGCIICSNCSADVGLATVPVYKAWLEENKDIESPKHN